MPAIVSAILGSKTFAVVAALAVAALSLFVWHQVDKGSAVRHAVASYVADVEVAALQAELAEQRRMRAATDFANRSLKDDLALAEADAEAANRELETYVSTVDPSCTVGPALFRRLHNK